MSYQLNRGNGCLRVIFVSILGVVLHSSCISSAKAQSTTWTITVDVSSGNARPVYSVTYLPLTGGCAYAAADANPENLHVCSGDTVQWQAVTKKDGSNKMQSELRVYLPDAFLLDKNGAPTYGFHGVDGLADGGKTNPAATAGIQYEYCVSVYDKVGNVLFLHDPKVIIGSGGPIELLVCGNPSSVPENKAKDAEKICEEAEHKLRDLLSRK